MSSITFLPGSARYAQDPYTVLHALRSQAPVFFSEQLDGWVLTRYDDCARVLADQETFLSDAVHGRGSLGEHVRALRARSPLGEAPLFGQSDPPVHQRLRAIINRAFTPRVVEAHRPFIAQAVAELLDDSKPGRPFDFMATLAERLPVAVIGDLLGFPREDRARVRSWAMKLMRAHSDTLSSSERRTAMEARELLRTYLARFAHTHRDEQGSRLIHILLEAEAEGETLSPQELLAFVVFLYTAGTGPTALLLANGMLALAEHPDQMALLREDPTLLPGAIEEMLRYDSPTQSLFRTAAHDTAVGGHAIRQGGNLVIAMVGAANRDPEQFPQPDRFDITRPREFNRHLSFGRGPHFCLGAPLARMEAEAAFCGMLERFPRLALAQGGLERGPAVPTRVVRRLVLTTA